MFELLFAPYQDYSTLAIILEAAAAAFGILSVWLAAKANIWVYPTGIISTGLYVYLLFAWGIYGDAVINIYYTAMSFWGWYLWRKKKKEGGSKLQITYLSVKGWMFLLMFSIANFIVFYLVLKNCTDSAIPVMDSVTTAIAFSAMYLQAKKKVESWVWWIACDVLSVGLYIYKDHALTTIQYTVFLVLATIGLVSWIRLEKQGRTA